MVSPFTKFDVEYARKWGEQNSPCSRRKYGAMIKGSDGFITMGANVRIGKSCTDTYCIRDRHGYVEGAHHDMEKGAEVHAEQAALISWRDTYLNLSEPYHILIAAVNHIGNLNGMENKPCYGCCRMLKYAGFDYVWLPFDDEPRPVSISGVMEEYEYIHQDI